MKDERRFYVYEHWRPDKDVCFYVGKGSDIRAYNMSNRKPHHKAIRKKLTAMGLSIEIRIFANGLTEDEAFDVERFRISQLRSQGIKLSNLTDGGEGVSGLTAYNRKTVVCMDTGEIFDSCTHAGEEMGINPSSISEACRGGALTAGGKRFMYLNGDFVPLDARNAAKARRRVKKNQSYGSISSGVDAAGRKSSGPMAISKKVLCLDTGEEFYSASEAARHFDVSKSAVIELCLGRNGRKTVGGLRFQYVGTN
jgi:hypothetical protein